GVDDAEVGWRHTYDLGRDPGGQSMPFDRAPGRPIAERSAFEMHHLLNLAPRGVDCLRQLAARADAAGDCDQKARRGWNLRHGRPQALGPVGAEQAPEDDPMRAAE